MASEESVNISNAPWGNSAGRVVTNVDIAVTKQSTTSEYEQAQNYLPKYSSKHSTTNSELHVLESSDVTLNNITRFGSACV